MLDRKPCKEARFRYHEILILQLSVSLTWVGAQADGVMDLETMECQKPGRAETPPWHLWKGCGSVPGAATQWALAVLYRCEGNQVEDLSVQYMLYYKMVQSWVSHVSSTTFCEVLANTGIALWKNSFVDMQYQRKWTLLINWELACKLPDDPSSELSPEPQPHL